MIMISVVIPIYNSSKYIRQCISSVLSQSFQDFELLLVNDGSTDNSLSICKNYEKRDSRVVIIDKKNEGVDEARFTGLKMAKGEYVTFIDSDDWIEPNTLMKMMNYAEMYSCDYVEVGMHRVLDKRGYIKRKSISPVLGLIQYPELFDKYYLSFFGYNILAVNMCGKLYRRDSLKKAILKPSGLKMGEDLYFNMMLFPYLNSIYLSDYIGYNYRFGGMTSKYNPSLYVDLKYLYQKKKELIEYYDYHKADDYIRYELINVFKSDVIQKIRFHTESEDRIINGIEEELKDIIWADISSLKKEYLSKSFPQAIIMKDSKKIYELCKEEVHDTKLEWMLKRVASRTLQYI